MGKTEVFDALKYRIDVSNDGDIRYFNADGQLHRETGPAAIWADGTKIWFQNGLRHRIDGPAIEFSNGHMEWYLNNRLHRTNGPAVVYSNGVCSWWINGVELPEADFNQAVKLL